MTRIAALAGALCLALAEPTIAEEPTICDRPHEAGNRHVVMILWRGPTEVERGFRDYVVRADLPVNVTCLSIDRDTSRLPEMIARANEIGPDLVYTWGTSVTRATVGEFDKVDPAKNVTDIPVIFTMVSYPVGSRIVESFEPSGRNVTGATHTVPLDAQIRAMQAYRPMKRLGVIYNPLENNSIVNVRKLKELAEAEDFDVIDLPVPLGPDGQPNPATLPDLIDQLAAREPQFLYIGPDNFVGEHRDLIIGEALERGLPAFTATELEIMRGEAMIGLVTGYYNLGRYMGYLAERVLMDGEDPGTIPISTLSRFTYALRLSVAARLGLYPPLDLLDYAYIVDREGT